MTHDCITINFVILFKIEHESMISINLRELEHKADDELIEGQAEIMKQDE